MNIPLILQPIFILLGTAAFTPIISTIGRKLNVERIREVFTILAFLLSFYSIYLLYETVSRSGAFTFSLGGFLPAGGGVELSADLFSIFMAFIICGVGLLVAVFSIRYMEKDSGLDNYYSLLLTLVAGMIGVFFAGDFFNLFVFWELMCISSYALVSFRKDTWEPVEAGFKYLVMSTIGSLIVLYGISLLYGITGTVNFKLMKVSLSGLGQQSTPLGLYLIIGLIIVGFGVTASIVPFHTWLPDAHPAAPSSISAMLSGVVIKTGVYALGRGLFTLFNPSLFDYGTVLLVFALLTLTVGNFMALLQSDVKRLLAYSSIVNIGYIISGIGIAGYILNRYFADQPAVALTAASVALTGALFHILNHALGKGLLFLGAGCYLRATESRDIGELEGIGRRMPWTGGAFSIGLFSLAGIPPLSGFWSKLFIITAGLSMPADPFLTTATAIIILNSIFSATYYLWLVQRVMLKEPRAKASQAAEAPFSMVAPIVILAIIIVILGLFPGLIVGLLEKVSKVFLGGW